MSQFEPILQTDFKSSKFKTLKGKSGTCVQNKINIVQNAQLKKDFSNN